MYQSPLFKYSLKHARKLNPDNIYILSAHYHLLDLETEIETYDVTLGYVKLEVKETKSKSSFKR